LRHLVNVDKTSSAKLLCLTLLVDELFGGCDCNVDVRTGWLLVSGSCDYPGVRIEWCPDPFQLTPKRTGDATEPEIWETDSEGIGRTSLVSSASVVDEHIYSFLLPPYHSAVALPQRLQPSSFSNIFVPSSGV